MQLSGYQTKAHPHDDAFLRPPGGNLCMYRDLYQDDESILFRFISVHVANIVSIFLIPRGYGF